MVQASRLRILGRVHVLAEVAWSKFGLEVCIMGLISRMASKHVGVSENWGVPYYGVLIIRILLFRVPY